MAPVSDPAIEGGVLPRPCGPYTLLSVLGAGGMAIVYLAEHSKLGQQVALKMIRPEFAADPRVLAFFGSEVHALAKIHHPNVVEVSNFFDSERGEKCLVMELLKAKTLRQLLAAREPLLFPDVLHIILQIASALRAAHSAGVIHRDLKPDNVAILQRPGFDEQRFFVKVLDFGVARVAAPAAEGREQIVGTLAYLAPELLYGSPADARSDAYALGVIMYELCAGSLPFDPTSEAAITRRRPDPPKLAIARPDLPVDFLQLVDACVAKDPEQRPASMQQIIAVVERLRGRATAFVHTSWNQKAVKPTLPLVAWLSTAAFIAIVAIMWPKREPVLAPPVAPPPLETAPVFTAPPAVPVLRMTPLSPIVVKPVQPMAIKALPLPPAAKLAIRQKPPARTVPNRTLPKQNLDERERLDDPKAENVPEIEP